MSSLKSLNVLVLDDNQHMRAIAATILHCVDVRNIHEAADGPAALDILASYPIDLALVDFNMFPMDGVAFTRRVRQGRDGANPYLPIIMMTGHSEKARVFEARDAGVTEFVCKPITARAVLERVNAVILRPRAFVRTDAYFGPCRRRREVKIYTGPFRRSGDVSRSNAA